MVGQKSPALLAVFKKADKKGGDLRSVWGALKEEPCSWGNAQRQYRAWRAEQGVAPAAKTPAAKPKPAGGAAASTAARTKAASGKRTLVLLASSEAIMAEELRQAKIT